MRNGDMDQPASVLQDAVQPGAGLGAENRLRPVPEYGCPEERTSWGLPSECRVNPQMKRPPSPGADQVLDLPTAEPCVCGLPAGGGAVLEPEQSLALVW